MQHAKKCENSRPCRQLKKGNTFFKAQEIIPLVVFAPSL